MHCGVCVGVGVQACACYTAGAPLTRSATMREVNRVAAVVGAGMSSSGERRVSGTGQAAVHTSSRARDTVRMKGSMERGLVPAERKQGKEEGGRVLPRLARRVQMLV